MSGLVQSTGEDFIFISGFLGSQQYPLVIPRLGREVKRVPHLPPLTVNS